MTTEHVEHQEYELQTPEVEGKKVPKPEDLDDQIEIVVEDDTPEEDRGRTPMPKPIVDELEADELEQYDDKVKERLKQMRKVWHDERRYKEAAIREQQAAIEYAKHIMEENKRLRGTLDSGSKEYAAMLQLTATRELEAAQRLYRDAYESGDTDKVIEAQQAMMEANTRLTQAKSFRLPPLQNQERMVQQQQVPVQRPQPPVQQPAPLDPKLESWQARNTWYGVDDEMTAAALGLHAKIEAEGNIPIGSDEYYATLDKTMRRRFPENFEGNNQTRQSQPSTVVAPAVRSTSPKRIRLTASQVALAKKLGITPEQYAREVKRMESENV